MPAAGESPPAPRTAVVPPLRPRRGARARELSVHIVVGREVLEVGEVRIHLDDVLERASRRLETEPQVLERSTGLLTDPAGDDAAGLVVSNLARRVDHLAADDDRRERRGGLRHTAGLEGTVGHDGSLSASSVPDKSASPPTPRHLWKR
jgi:hypothetical protein